jgi:mevalonate kinase
MADDLRAETSILGAKISGSGMGDCIVGLGEVPDSFTYENKSVQRIPVAMTLQGVQCEKI